MKSLSVIICTHNPRQDFLQRTLQALEAQTLPKSEWELLIIDNASKEPVAANWDLSWHPHARHIRENEVGLTFARLCGIKESQAPVLVFVDDDNLLKVDYLEVALNTMKGNQLLGVLGAGRILPEFETPPLAETLPFVDNLALRDMSRPVYSNEMRFTPALPYGAGMCVLKRIALLYAESCGSQSAPTTLGRSGKSLLSGEDIDLALHACREDMLAGVIPELELMHLIPAFRLKPDYLVKLISGHAAANYHLAKVWGWPLSSYSNPVLRMLRFWRRWLKLKGLAKKIFVASAKATLEAESQWLKFENN
jgi:glycosyltransferase involved in cell wall biosynthesis